MLLKGMILFKFDKDKNELGVVIFIGVVRLSNKLFELPGKK